MAISSEDTTKEGHHAHSVSHCSRSALIPALTAQTEEKLWKGLQYGRSVLIGEDACWP